MKTVHFITGGTGFVGSSLILELLRQTDAEIFCLVRSTGDHSSSRLHKVLLNAAKMYDYDEDILEAICGRCHAVQGDLLQENCGVTHLLPRIDEFWHCAASLCYENRYADEIFATNVTGTEYALALAKQLGVQTFNYMSTAYVAGTSTGAILERTVGQQDTNNLYERSKIMAEEQVTNTPNFRSRIFRPGIVVGHSKTLAAMNFSGLYGFLRKLTRFKALMGRIHEGFCLRESVRMFVEPDALLNLVPVDHVARQAVQVSLSNSQATVFHLTNATPITVGEALTETFRVTGIKSPQFVKSKEDFSWIDGKFGNMVDFYNSYLIAPKVFDRTNTDSAIGNTQDGSHPYDTSAFIALCQWYLDCQAKLDSVSETRRAA